MRDEAAGARSRCGECELSVPGLLLRQTSGDAICARLLDRPCVSLFCVVSSELARPRTFPQHTLPLLPLLRSRPGGVHKASVVRSPGSDKSKNSVLAERVGFEPTERFPVHSIS